MYKIKKKQQLNHINIKENIMRVFLINIDLFLSVYKLYWLNRKKEHLMSILVNRKKRSTEPTNWSVSTLFCNVNHWFLFQQSRKKNDILQIYLSMSRQNSSRYGNKWLIISAHILNTNTNIYTYKRQKR